MVQPQVFWLSWHRQGICCHCAIWRRPKTQWEVARSHSTSMGMKLNMFSAKQIEFPGGTVVGTYLHTMPLGCIALPFRIIPKHNMTWHYVYTWFYCCLQSMHEHCIALQLQCGIPLSSWGIATNRATSMLANCCLKMPNKLIASLHLRWGDWKLLAFFLVRTHDLAWKQTRVGCWIHFNMHPNR